MMAIAAYHEALTSLRWLCKTTNIPWTPAIAKRGLENAGGRAMFQKLHHVAYRCRDAQETVDFYTKVLGLKYAAGEASPEGHKP